ncbi:hypothetical protein LO763_20065 [Glycomyces sp. A-F 0318]|uniref:hypothetical protein n=1 Tax=Glycomyces amatae TaxID=2881355 RepID=UPI001E5B2AE4|nr:hypothetical protein [Glycomyces amatae]MCD0445910.1 hypothetical protein [Glycomyces amatae]
MANKVQLGKHVEKLNKDLDDAEAFVDAAAASDLRTHKQHMSYVYDAAILKAWVAFERFMLTCLTAAINHDSKAISVKIGIEFPVNLNKPVCEYLITGGGFFDFKGFGGLVDKTKKFLPNDHWLPRTLKREKEGTSVYQGQIDRFAAVRNFAAHESPQSKKRFREVTGQERMPTAGSWLKVGSRFTDITTTLRELAKDLEREARR